ncbi:MAG: SpoIIE family protein phosphatase [Candidatus Gallimonas sp.]
MSNLYRSVLNHIPTAAIVVDKNFKVRYANKAFRDYFPAAQRGRGSLRDVVGCGERDGKCGAGIKCAYCPVRNLFADAIGGNGLAFRNLIMKSGESGEKNVALRIKVKPLGKYYLGVVDNAYEMEIAREMHSAQDIQQRLLPPAKSGGAVPYSFMYIPCREIGGDLPDVYEVDGDTVGVIADVSGKGISAGMLSAFVKAGWDRSEPSPARAIRRLNAKFQELNLDETSYVTAAAVRLDREKREICYSVAGHNAPILLKSGMGIDEIVMNSPPVSNWIPDFEYEDRLIGYRKGDVLVLLTDGTIESKNDAGEQFSLDRIEAILQRSYNAEHFIERLKAELTAFCGTFDDDLTAIAFDL